MWLLVGLGNPGNEYAETRHNIGFQAVDTLVRRFSFSSFREQCHGQISSGTIQGQKCLILKPSTYMNLSGESVQSALSYYKITPQNVIVFHDDLDLPVGKVKVKIGGSSGGHNGIKNIDSHIGPQYMRVRIGIDHNRMIDTADYVLGKIEKENRPIFQQCFDKIADSIELLFNADMNGFMNRIK